MNIPKAAFGVAYFNFPHARNWPTLVIGVIVAVYWWRVLRMAYKMRRRTGRGANFVPAEPLGKILRFIWQPVVWLWIAHPLTSAFIVDPPVVLRPLYSSACAGWAAVVVAASASALTRLCWKRMGKSWRMGIDPAERTPLVVTGPYAYVRHPIYALSSLLMIATVVALPSPLMMLVAIVHLMLLQWESRREERHLCRVHGQPYQLYCMDVGRFLPRRFHRHGTVDDKS